jgi:hypothetical protein
MGFRCSMSSALLNSHTKDVLTSCWAEPCCHVPIPVERCNSYCRGCDGSLLYCLLLYGTPHRLAHLCLLPRLVHNRLLTTFLVIDVLDLNAREMIKRRMRHVAAAAAQGCFCPLFYLPLDLGHLKCVLPVADLLIVLRFQHNISRNVPFATI